MRTREELRDYLRDLIDAPEDDDFYSAAVLNRFLNRSLRTLAMRILDKYPNFYYSNETITTTADTQTHTLTECWKLISVYDIANNYKMLEPIPITELRDRSQTAQYADYYALTNDGTNYKLWLDYTPSTTGTQYLSEYFRIPSDMSADANNPDFPPGYEDLISMQAAKLAFIKSDDAAIEKVMFELAEMESRMMDGLSTWQAVRPPQIQRSRWMVGPRGVRKHGHR